MREKGKYLFTGLLCTGLVLIGCENNDKKIDPKTLLTKAIEKMEAIDRFEATYKTVLTIATVEGDQVVIASDEQIKADKSQKDVYEITTHIEVTMGEETQSYEIEQYLEGNDKQYDMYTRMEDEWEKEIIKPQNIQQRLLSPEGIIKYYIEETEEIRWGKEKEINNTPCDEIIMNFNMENVSDKERIYMFVGKLLRLNGLEISDDEINDKLQESDEAEEFTFYIYIDQETGKIVSESWEIEELAKNILLSVQEMDQDEFKAFEFSFDSFYEEVDKKVGIKIPDSVKDMAQINQKQE